MSSSAQMRIGQVVKLLKPEFPDITISKLRFLEDQDLVRPERTAGGYRMYTEGNIRQLRHILAMQRDEFLPLRVIKAELTRRLAGGAPSAAPVARASAAAARVSLTAAEQFISLGELCERASVTPEFVEECRAFDLVSGRRAQTGGVEFSTQEAEIVICAAELSRMGLDVRNLRQVRSAVGRQASLVEQFAAARLRSKSDDQRLAGLRGVEQLSNVLSEFIRHAFVRDVRLMTARAVGAAPLRMPSPSAMASAIMAQHGAPSPNVNSSTASTSNGASE